MSAPRHSALRSVHGLHQRGGSEWERCPEAGCTGIALPEANGACWQHADDKGGAAALGRMREQRHFDLRGTVLSPELLESGPFLLADRRRDGRDLSGWVAVSYEVRPSNVTPLKIAVARRRFSN